MIIVTEGGDIQIFESAEAAAAYVEAIDVLNDEYLFHDDTGRVYVGVAESETDPVQIVPAEPARYDAEGLAQRIRTFLTRGNWQPPDKVESATLPELVAFLQEVASA